MSREGDCIRSEAFVAK